MIVEVGGCECVGCVTMNYASVVGILAKCRFRFFFANIEMGAVGLLCKRFWFVFLMKLCSLMFTSELPAFVF